MHSTVDSGLTITSSLQSHGKALEKECCLPGVFCDSGDTPANLFCELTLSRAGPVTGHAALDCEIGLTEGAWPRCFRRIGGRIAPMPVFWSYLRHFVAAEFPGSSTY